MEGIWRLPFSEEIENGLGPEEVCVVGIQGDPKKWALCTLYVISLLFIHQLPLFYRTWQNQ